MSVLQHKIHHAFCTKCQLEYVYTRFGDDMGIIEYEYIYCIQCNNLMAKPRVGYFNSKLLNIKHLDNNQNFKKESVCLQVSQNS
jgi:NAD-dependent SIR2 family protein deacetylase